MEGVNILKNHKLKDRRPISAVQSFRKFEPRLEILLPPFNEA